MKKILPLIIFSLATLFLNAQECSDLFISQYIEGYGNNRALEIYNPTNSPINLSAYSIGRYANGGNIYEGIELPDEMIQPYETFLAVLDKRDSLGSGFETPVWNGYQLYDYCTDGLTGDTILNMDGDTVFCVQYDSTGLHLYGDVYRDFLDLEGKADGFFCPVYNVNNAMYFNGNDAVVLVKGLDVANDGSNILDVIGVIGNPDMINNDAWVDASGGWLTRDKTLIRKSSVKEGTGPIAHALQDTFAYAQYEVWFKNYFGDSNEHGCECDPDFVTSTNEINQVGFSIYPNPTNAELIVTADEAINKVEIYNLLGELVLVERAGTTGNEKLNLNVGQFDTGMYVISLFFDGDRQSVQKFIKQ
ncbi:MAG: T9SS type A sorting domain-containing protein [Bacteroidota bacterium]